ncbi:MAG: hypothetical protein GF355_05075 [Candidatus Eisenbacteria bacterium]|nr:hypothetical protein [Candidatus Eisenbacteria bacterium]
MGIAGLLLLLLPAAPCGAQGSTVSIEPGAQTGEARPGDILTLPLTIANQSHHPVDLVERVDLPDGWTAIFPDPRFSLAAGESRSRVLALRIPQKSLARTYPLRYEVLGGGGNALLGRHEIEVAVGSRPGLQLRVEDGDGFVAAGSEHRITMAVTNSGNTALQISLSAESDRRAELTLLPPRVELAPGESRLVHLLVVPDREIDSWERMTVWVAASGAADDAVEVVEKIWFTLDSAGRDGPGPRYRAIPSRLSLLGMSGEGTAGQAELTGRGSIEDRYEIAYLLRGPDARETVGFTQPSVYHVRLAAPNLELTVGDGSWRLSRLMNDYRYGRGAGVVADAGALEAGAHIFRGRFVSHPQDEAGGYVRAAVTRETAIQLNLLRRELQGKAHEDGAFEGVSLAAETQVLRNTDLYLEYGTGGPGAGGGWRPLEDAGYFGLAEGSLGKRVRFALHHIHAGPQFHGHYRDLENTRGVVSGIVRRGATDLRLFARVRRATQNLDRRAEHGPAYRRLDLAAGAELKPAPAWFGRLSVSRDHARNRLPDGAPDFESTALRLVAGRYRGLSGFTVEGQAGIQEQEPGGGESVHKSLGFNAHLARDADLALSVFGRWSDQGDAGEKQRDGRISGGGSVKWVHRRGSGIELGFQLKRSRLFTSHQTDLDAWWPVSAAVQARLRARHRDAPGTGSELFLLLGLEVSFDMPLFPRPRRAALRGRVFDAQRPGRPGLEGVLLQLDDRRAVTGPDGAYEINGLLPGSHLVRIDPRSLGLERVPLQPAPLQAEITGSEELTLNIGVSDGGLVRGRLVAVEKTGRDEHELLESAGKGPPDLKGILVEMTDGRRRRVTLTDRRGRFQFHRVRPGRWRLEVDGSGLPRALAADRLQREIMVRAGQVTVEEIVLSRRTRPIRFVETGESITVDLGGSPAAEPLQEDGSGDRAAED